MSKGRFDPKLNPLDPCSVWLHHRFKNAIFLGRPWRIEVGGFWFECDGNFTVRCKGVIVEDSALLRDNQPVIMHAEDFGITPRGLRMKL